MLYIATHNKIDQIIMFIPFYFFLFISAIF